MAQFSKESLSFLNALDEEVTAYFTGIPNSPSRMTPGEILIFRYNPKSVSFYRTVRGRFSSNQRVVLIVSCNRGEGVFPGKTSTLMSCFKLEGNSEYVVAAILENLYTSESGGNPVKRRDSSYYGNIKESLIALLGEANFRTYKTTSMRAIYKIELMF